MHLSRCLSATLALGTLCSLAHAQSPQPSLATPHATAKTHSRISETEARRLAQRYSGIPDSLTSDVVAEQVTHRDNLTPFLAGALTGRPAWLVKYRTVSFDFPSTNPAHDRFKRTLEVSIDAFTGQLLEIVCASDQAMDDVKPMPDAASATRQLKADRETYAGLLRPVPEVSFWAALDALETKSLTSPLLAKDIRAVYVMETRMGSAPGPIWAITVRGIPPLPAKGGGPG